MGALALVLLTCLAIDVSNPLLPGVVRFDDDESIYWLRAERPRVDDRVPATPAPAPRACVSDFTVELHARGGPAPLSGVTATQHRPGRPRGTIKVARAGPPTDEDH